MSKTQILHYTSASKTDLVKLACKEQIDYNLQTPLKQYKDNYDNTLKNIITSTGIDQDLADQLTPDALKKKNEEYRQQYKDLHQALISDTALTVKQQRFFDNIVEKLEAQGIRFNGSDEDKKKNNTTPGVLILSATNAGDKDNLEGCLKEQGANADTLFRADLKAVWAATKGDDGKFLLPQDGKEGSGLPQRIRDFQNKNSEKDFFTDDKHETTLADRIGFHWGRTLAVGEKQAAGLSAGGFVSGDFAPGTEAAQPGGHTHKELGRIEENGHPITMIVAYRPPESLPEKASDREKGTAQNIALHQTPLYAQCENVSILDAAALEKGERVVLATKKGKDSPLEIKDVRFIEEIKKNGLDLQKAKEGKTADSPEAKTYAAYQPMLEAGQQFLAKKAVEYQSTKLPFVERVSIQPPPNKALAHLQSFTTTFSDIGSPMTFAMTNLGASQGRQR